MAVDPMTGFDPDNDDDLKQANARFAAAGDQAKAEAAQAAFTKAAPQTDQPSGLQHWLQDLPQNIGSGLITAAVNTADALHSGLRWVDDGQRDAQAKLALASGTKGPDEMQREREAGSSIETPEYSTVRNAVQDFNQKYIAVQNPTLSDNITQGIAQFAIPFLGWSKAVSTVGGVGKLATLGRSVFAEGATAGTAMAPHDGRFADMVDLGMHTEGKFADALNAIAPDGSLVNTYINYMTNRDGETEAEGRVKNIVDMLTGGAVISPLITTGMKMLKGGLDGLKYSLENGVGSIDQLAVPNQAGRIGYHGTPHDFDTEAGFDNSKIGSGEGAQVYGYGHYLAESPEVAGQYQTNLVARDARNQPLQLAQQYLKDAGGDSVKAYKALDAKYDQLMASDSTMTERGAYVNAQRLLKAGNVNRGAGSLVTADIPDEHIANMLDHDAPMTDQQHILDKIPEADKAQLLSTLEEVQGPEGNGALEDLKGGQFRKLLERTISDGGIDGPDLMDDHTARQASQYLDSKGIPGIKYLDGASRGGGEGTRNIVLFDGKKATIVAKNGKPVTH